MPIFEGDGRPLAFHLDASIRKGARQKLAADIKEHGGTVVERLNDADFSIVDEQHSRGGRTLLSLGQAYGLTFPNLRFRGLNFVQACIRQGAIFTPVVIRKAMGGVPPREQRGRREFTPRDDEHLAEYLATVVPDPASGGRTGNAIYSKLCSNPEIPWAGNHPWESWRTRYKNKRQWFDSKVADIVRARPANPEALHVQDRRLNRRPYNDAYHLREEEEERTDEEADPQASLSPSFRPSPVLL
uniref:DNA-binding protein RAP1 n=1 Tax=Pleurotus ostreatus TaxID=5322 RepID=A0A2Z5EN55_PLEOS|nr:MYB transcription factor 18 [Pleurotus ostreatus]